MKARRRWPSAARERAGARTLVRALPAVALAAVVVPLVTGCSDRDPRETNARPELTLERSPDYDYDPPAPGTYALPVLGSAAGGRVVDAAGRERTLHDLLQDRITVLSFVYTRCADPKACPMATGVLGTVQSISEQDPVLARRLRLLTFSFDPDHDTPKVMSEYGNRVASSSRKASEWMFLTTRSAGELEPILDAYGQRVDRKKDPEDPLGPLNHLVRVYLIDGEGMIRNIYSFGLLDPRLLLADVRTLLIEETERKNL